MLRTITSNTETPNTGSRMLETALTQLNNAFELLFLDEGLRALIRQPERELTVAVPIRRDSGTLSIYTGYRVQHSSARGPCWYSFNLYWLPGAALLCSRPM
jgi:glutamate dehydrogenase (NAD(P)+)